MQKKRIVIAGGGFGGVFAAQQLQKLSGDQYQIELISENNYFVFQPLLPEVASGTINVQDAVSPLRLLLPKVKVRQAEVVDVDTEKKQLIVVQGRKRVLIPIAYDHLILATGQVTNLESFHGFEQHSLTMKNLSDAHQLRNHIIQCLELADVTEDEVIKKRMLTFVVAGGGFSGVETIGEMVEMIQRTLRFYPNINKDDVECIMVQSGARILPELPEKLSQYAREKLEKRGVEILLHEGVKSASATTLTLGSGKKLNTSTIVCTIGNGPSPFIRKIDLPQQHGKICVNRHLQVEGQSNIWSLGDTALVPLKDQPTERTDFAPPTAQFTVREASQLAKNIHALESGKAMTAFTFTPRGMLASLGNYSGVASMFGINMSGLFAWLLWRSFYIALLPGFATRLRVGLNWFYDYFLPRTIVQVQQASGSGCKYMHFSAGELVFDQNQLLDGLHIVVSGKLEMRIAATDDQQEFVKQIGAGDHWGEKILENQVATTGVVTALEDSLVLVMDKTDFGRLKQALPSFRDYFDQINPERYSSAIKKTDINN
ncbi:FAD-dependent oxidoreductase [Pelagibaculum spongiae]|uniref:NADH:ubiquinone reductase (non-electrogenic) n=1 Tax=Pelagibaculum spongiae TaxID=2080658 RepID=A0A2V1GVH6_9GAMM|nr:FAD-dependent oxidoreductase [Pelagibaculum spongiae]PVZ64349.1 nucleotide-disulfide oxidoreductase [Pelagibaculum spongiae]